MTTDGRINQNDLIIDGVVNQGMPRKNIYLVTITWDSKVNYEKNLH